MFEVRCSSYCATEGRRIEEAKPGRHEQERGDAEEASNRFDGMSRCGTMSPGCGTGRDMQGDDHSAAPPERAEGEVGTESRTSSQGSRRSSARKAHEA